MRRLDGKRLRPASYRKSQANPYLIRDSRECKYVHAAYMGRNQYTDSMNTSEHTYGVDGGLLGTWEGPAIGLLDLDAFFASVEQLDHPEWRGKPVIVGGSPVRRGVVSTASYEARAFGVHSAMSSSQAKRLCPQAIWTGVRFDRYRELSSRVMASLEDETPFVDQVSIDEAFFDITPGRFCRERLARHGHPGGRDAIRGSGLDRRGVLRQHPRQGLPREPHTNRPAPCAAWAPRRTPRCAASAYGRSANGHKRPTACSPLSSAFKRT